MDGWIRINEKNAFWKCLLKKEKKKKEKKNKARTSCSRLHQVLTTPFGVLGAEVIKESMAENWILDLLRFLFSKVLPSHLFKLSDHRQSAAPRKRLNDVPSSRRTSDLAIFSLCKCLCNRVGFCLVVVLTKELRRLLNWIGVTSCGLSSLVEQSQRGRLGKPQWERRTLVLERCRLKSLQEKQMYREPTIPTPSKRRKLPIMIAVHKYANSAASLLQYRTHVISNPCRAHNMDYLHGFSFVKMLINHQDVWIWRLPRGVIM